MITVQLLWKKNEHLYKSPKHLNLNYPIKFVFIFLSVSETDIFYQVKYWYNFNFIMLNLFQCITNFLNEWSSCFIYTASSV